MANAFRRFCYALCGSLVLLVLPAVVAGSQEAVIYSFQGGSDGAYPLAGLVADSAGHLYGTTQAGGAGTCKAPPPPGGCGTIFELTPPAMPGHVWTKNVIYHFTGGDDGANPWAGLILDQRGNLYGTAEFGGQGKGGTVFELSPPAAPGGAWTQIVLYAFQGARHGGDGANPQGSLTFDKSGNLFGTTYAGGIPCSDSAPSGCGTIFELTPPSAAGGAWTENVIYRFDPSFAGGPSGALIFDAKGNFYGTAVNDGALGGGTAYRFTLSSGGWTRTVLHTFGGATDGGYVYAGLIFGKGGALYGATTGYGGQVGNGGTVFKLGLTASGSLQETLLAVFPGENGFTEGPFGALVTDASGALYGATNSGGTGTCLSTGGWRGCGFVFKLTPPAAPGGSWTETTLHNFAGGSDGAESYANLIFGPGHKLYGTTSTGGSGPCAQGTLTGCGTVFEIVP